VNRQKVHAKAAVQIIVDVAKVIPDVSILRVSAVKDNRIAKRMVKGLGSPKVEDMHPR
jgi:hypothetical protein